MANVSSHTDDIRYSIDSSHDWELVAADQYLCGDAPAIEEDQVTLSFVPDTSKALRMDYFNVSENFRHVEDSTCTILPGELTARDDQLTFNTFHQEREALITDRIPAVAQLTGVIPCKEMTGIDDSLPPFVTFDLERETLTRSSVIRIPISCEETAGPGDMRDQEKEALIRSSIGRLVDAGMKVENPWEQMAGKEDRKTFFMLDQEEETLVTSSINQFATADMTVASSCKEMSVADCQLKFVTLEQEKDLLSASRECDIGHLAVEIQGSHSIADERGKMLTLSSESGTSAREVADVQKLQRLMVQSLDGIETVAGKEEEVIIRRSDSPFTEDEEVTETELLECARASLEASLGVSAGHSRSSVSKPSVFDGNDNFYEACWKRKISKLQTERGRGSTFWSIVMASTVISVLILGHKWHYARMQNKRLRMELDMKEQKISQLMYQLVRMRECIYWKQQVPVVRMHSTIFSGFQAAVDVWL